MAQIMGHKKALHVFEYKDNFQCLEIGQNANHTSI